MLLAAKTAFPMTLDYQYFFLIIIFKKSFTGFLAWNTNQAQCFTDTSGVFSPWWGGLNTNRLKQNRNKEAMLEELALKTQLSTLSSKHTGDIDNNKKQGWKLLLWNLLSPCVFKNTFSPKVFRQRPVLGCRAQLGPAARLKASCVLEGPVFAGSQVRLLPTGLPAAPHWGPCPYRHFLVRSAQAFLKLLLTKWLQLP